MNKTTHEKLYLGAGDINIINVISQKNQIQIFKSYLSEKNSSIAYDVYENPETSHDLLRLQKVSSQSRNKTFGIIFYSLIQLCYGKKIRLDLIEKFTISKFELIFFREGLVIKNYKDFQKQKKKYLFLWITT